MTKSRHVGRYHIAIDESVYVRRDARGRVIYDLPPFPLMSESTTQIQ